MPLSAGTDQNQTTSRILNKLQYAVTDVADDITTATTSDIMLMFDASDNYEPKYADSANIFELMGVTASAAELNITDGVLATAAEINRAADVSTRLVAAGSTLAVTEASHDGKTILLDTAAGSTCTLPAAAGTGAIFRFVVSVVPTSNQHRLSVTGNDTFFGNVWANSTGDTPDLGQPWPAAAGNNQVNLNGTTTGGLSIGDYIEVQDIVTDKWHIIGFVTANGTEATPFATV